MHVWSGDSWPLSPADCLDLRAQSKSFSAFGAYQPSSVNVGREHARGRGPAWPAPSDVLRAFGVQPLLGRFFGPDDDKDGAPPVVILSYPLWQDLFAGDQAAIGRTLRLNETDYTVVGVMP